MILLCDIGNTHTHLGLANQKRVIRHCDIPTGEWGRPAADRALAGFVRGARLNGVSLCSVVPACTGRVVASVRRSWRVPTFLLTHESLRGVGIDYPKPASIGPDRLSNALAVKVHFGAPSLVVDFGTAVTFDVVDARGAYVGGIIAPGLAAMTDYLHEKTALLPRIRIRDVDRIVGKNTEEAMLIGAVHGYRGLVKELIAGLKKELGAPRLPVVATGGYAKLIARGVPQIRRVEPLLTLEGLRLAWEFRSLPSVRATS